MNETQDQGAPADPGPPIPRSVPAAEEDARLVQALDEYLASVEEGHPPERPAFLARYPEIAPTLEKCLEGLHFVERVGPQLDEAAGSEAEAPVARVNAIQPEGPLGDYRLVREIGRGGMGVVYEAVQISLGRRVAVKVLPFAAALDSKSLQRFKNEAQAAAHLHHENIVPIYAVGCERGVHFYAMQFIDGQPMTAILRELRAGAGLPPREPAGSAAHTASPGPALVPPQAGAVGLAGPTALSESRGDEATARLVATLATGRSTTSPAFFQSIARLGVQAALALEHAHQMGVVHRDIKPANLLVDVLGKVWVTDFGLAHLQSNPGLTITGDLLGTIRYMSPEQALGKRAPADPRSDVFALGVTLYEMLTLEPAYDGQDRQEVLRQIAFDVPRAPRQVNRAIPVELETIVLKAMEKNPGDRYAGAQELADDLRRFLENKPIHARRPGLKERLTKWAWRHKPLVAAGGLVLLVAVVALAVCTVLVWQEKVRTVAALAEAEKQGRRAEESFQKTRAALAEAEKQGRRAEESFQKTRAALAEAEKQGRRAEVNLQKALAAVEQMLTRLSAEDVLPNIPGMDRVRHQLLKDALWFYQDFLQENRTDPRVRRDMAATYGRIGDLDKRLGNQAAAEEDYHAEMALFQGLADEFPQRPDYRFDLAGCYTHLGNLLVHTPRREEAERAFRRALAIQQVLVKEFPRSARYREDLAGSHNNLGNLLTTTQRLPDAEQELRQALDQRRRLVEEFPQEPTHQQHLARGHHNLGMLLERTNRSEEAEKAFRQALELQMRLVEKYPHVSAYRQELAGSHNLLGVMLARTKRLQEAEKEYENAFVLQRKLVADSPRVPAYRQELARTHHNRALLLQRRRQFREAEQAYQKALDLEHQLVEEFPKTASFQSELAKTVGFLADLQFAQGRVGEARQNFEKAIRHQRLALKLSPGQPSFTRALGSI
jgi:serine/threonine protein kinase/Flp pilus assembly protein TadD